MTLHRSVGFLPLLRSLRQHCPPVLPMRVRRCKIPASVGAIADCALMSDDEGKPSHSSIRVASRLPEIAACDALAHEVAHALAYTTEHPAFLDHGPEWGLAMARVYRAHEALLR